MVSLIILIVVCQAVGLVSAAFTRGAIREWYPSLRKPSFNPPNWVFAPVWTVLYLLMGIAGHVVWQTRHTDIPFTPAFTLFCLQLVVNGMWSLIFFGLRAPRAGLVNLIVLVLLVAGCVVVFWPSAPVASLLFVPYLVWIVFAMVLNYSIVVLNRAKP